MQQMTFLNFAAANGTELDLTSHANRLMTIRMKYQALFYMKTQKDSIKIVNYHSLVGRFKRY